MFWRIVVWRNKERFYYKKVKGFYCEYYVGMKNQYDHEVILIIEVSEFIKDRKAFKTRIIDKLVTWLEKIKKAR